MIVKPDMDFTRFSVIAVFQGGWELGLRGSRGITVQRVRITRRRVAKAVVRKIASSSFGALTMSSPFEYVKIPKVKRARFRARTTIPTPPEAGESVVIDCDDPDGENILDIDGLDWGNFGN